MVALENRKNKNKSYKISGKLKELIALEIVTGIVLLITTISMYAINVYCGNILLAVTIIFALAIALITAYLGPSIIYEMVKFSSNFSHVQRDMINELSVPYALMDENGHMLWGNKMMTKIIGHKVDVKKTVDSVFPEIKVELFPQSDDSKEIGLSFNDRDYSVELKRIKMTNLMDDVDIVDETKEESAFIVMYMFDNTDINMYIKKIRDERFVVGQIYIDNYEDVLESVDDARKSLLIGLVDKRVNKYFAQGGSIVRKLEKDKYLVVFRYKFLEQLMEDKFSILEDIKTIKARNEMTITLSIAIGTGSNDYSKNYDIARAAMDLALGRGGDQAVVKDGDKTLYYGGKSQQMEKNTRVKVRVKAHALTSILESTDNVLIMGHKFPDVDSFGSAIGMFAICARLGRKAHIVINEDNLSIKPFMNKFLENEDYPNDMFVDHDSVSAFVNSQTALIVVDVNIPDRTDCPQLLNQCKTKIVFDHHRQTSEFIKNAVISYIDPYASSASEMITEMIQYIDDGVKIKPYEADAMYAGIVIDTDGFNNKSGPRTFEAAAYLRRHGADVNRVRKMLRTDMDEYRAIAKAVSEATVYRDAYAITIFDGDGLSSPTIGGAKAANQLLDISGIKASFAITRFNDIVYLSARSIDDVNVQLIMEKLGGGGHMTIAAAQLKECTPDQAVQTIKVTIDSMLNNGEL